MRNALAHAGRTGRRVVSAFIATAFAQDDAEAAGRSGAASPTNSGQRYQARDPDGRGRGGRAGLHDLPGPTPGEAPLDKPLERLNGEIKRRTEVVGIFPNEAAITRLVGAILLEQNDEWAVLRARYMTLETMTTLSDDPVVSLPAMAA